MLIFVYKRRAEYYTKALKKASRRTPYNKINDNWQPCHRRHATQSANSVYQPTTPPKWLETSSMRRKSFESAVVEEDSHFHNLALRLLDKRKRLPDYV